MKGVYAYLDDCIVVGHSEKDHDENFNNFLKTIKSHQLTLNREKCIVKKPVIRALGYEISYKTLRPDPTLLEPIRKLNAPQKRKELLRINGLFVYYSRWIPNFSNKIRPLVDASLPLNNDCLNALETLENSIIHSVRANVDEYVQFCVENDASDVAISAILSQNDRPVVFFSRTLNAYEQKHHSVEKEAYAIVESIRFWHHFLAPRHFTLITDQKSVTFMFDSNMKNKIKNEKILRWRLAGGSSSSWRLEIMPCSYEILHRPGSQNVAADALSRPSCSSVYVSDLSELSKIHASLCHPGIARMTHFVKSKNLPFLVEEIRKITAGCKTCATWKPRYFRPPTTHLIKALRPFDRLSLDFKGPLPTTKDGYKYLLVAVDEYSRFPFAFPCRDINIATVIRCLSNIFSIFGTVNYIHSDNASCLK